MAVAVHGGRSGRDGRADEAGCRGCEREDAGAGDEPWPIRGRHRRDDRNRRLRGGLRRDGRAGAGMRRRAARKCVVLHESTVVTNGVERCRVRVAPFPRGRRPTTWEICAVRRTVERPRQPARRAPVPRAQRRGDGLSARSDARAGSPCCWRAPAVRLVHQQRHVHALRLQFKKLLENMAGKAEAAGAQVLYKTPAVQLVQDEREGDQRHHERSDGSFVQVNAAKGVVWPRATSPTTRRWWSATRPSSRACRTSRRAVQHRREWRCGPGASIDSAPHCIMMHFDPGATRRTPAGCGNLKGAVRDRKLGYRASSLRCASSLRQTAFQITDANWAVHASVDENPYQSCRRCIQPAATPPTRRPIGTTPSARRHRAGGRLGHAQSLADVEGAGPASRDAFLKTVARYNELVDKGVDEDLGVRGDATCPGTPSRSRRSTRSSACRACWPPWAA